MAERETIGAAGTTALRTAELLIQRHGAGALAFAREQMQRLADTGAAGAAADWQAVVQAVEDLTRAPPKP